MVLGILSGLNFVQIVLFLLPGLVGIKTALWFAHRADWLDQIDTIGASFLLSLVAIATVYGYHSTGVVPCSLNLLTPEYCSGLLSQKEIKSQVAVLPVAIRYYLQLYAVSIAIGLSGGVLYYRLWKFGETIPRKELWSYYFGGIRKGGTESIFREKYRRAWESIHQWNPLKGDPEEYLVRVYTTDGTILSGKVDREGEISQNRDIVLKSPSLYVLNEEMGDADLVSDWTGSAYIHDQAISHVQFDELGSADESSGKRDESEATQEDDEGIERLEDIAEGEESDQEEKETD